jgi:Ca2+-transporting ATPase
LAVAAKAGIERDNSGDEIVHEIPFDSERKAMSLVVIAEGRRRMCTKGAPEVVLGWATHEWQGGQRRELSDERGRQWLVLADEMASHALRVLAVAVREYPLEYQGEYEESGLTLVGLLGMMDPPRPEAVEAVRRCRAAGIRPVMITGDHPATARAIGLELTIATGDRVATGKDLDALSDERLADEVEELSVYARVTAEHKQRIVRALKNRGHIVAMTGDGVNDAPAIVAADIGIAMGRTGTDVTKAASDMVLTDDNFSSIVNAVEEGRGIFENIQKVVQFLLSCNAGEVMFMFFSALAGWPLPLLPIHLLWMNLITDGLPALTLAMEPPEPDIMARPPRPPRQPVLTLARGVRMVSYGALFAVSIALGFAYVYYAEGESVERARTVAFCVACYAQIFFAFGCRSDHFTAPKLGFFTNRPLLLAMTASAALQLATVLLPIGQRIFETTDVTADQRLVILGLALLPVTLVELFKFLPRGGPAEQQPVAGT